MTSIYRKRIVELTSLTRLAQSRKIVLKAIAKLESHERQEKFFKFIILELASTIHDELVAAHTVRPLEKADIFRILTKEFLLSVSVGDKNYKFRVTGPNTFELGEKDEYFTFVLDVHAEAEYVVLRRLIRKEPVLITAESASFQFTEWPTMDPTPKGVSDDKYCIGRIVKRMSTRLKRCYNLFHQQSNKRRSGSGDDSSSKSSKSSVSETAGSSRCT